MTLGVCQSPVVSMAFVLPATMPSGAMDCVPPGASGRSPALGARTLRIFPSLAAGLGVATSKGVSILTACRSLGGGGPGGGCGPAALGMGGLVASPFEVVGTRLGIAPNCDGPAGFCVSSSIRFEFLFKISAATLGALSGIFLGDPKLGASTRSRIFVVASAFAAICAD